MTRLPLTVVLLGMAVVTGCPRPSMTSTVQGSAEERADALSAQVEELASKPEEACPGPCSSRARACSVATDLCDIAARLDRADLTRRCTAAQELCAQLGDACRRC